MVGRVQGGDHSDYPFFFFFFSNINKSFNWMLIFHICLCRWVVLFFLGGSRQSVSEKVWTDVEKREVGEVGRAC